eukprot:gnl/Carplike_NY0171/3990_a5394_213.p1 GENE.gnl/Carplike_NY0171/3990_a5394_213~~gnl/Carplike_NY0171/3990_a5394_213.p1  ORF type:complete len:853 (-),score=215.95 gnl/Carplike_NY0171/3990_a5394_213:63-2387(-)
MNDIVCPFDTFSFYNLPPLFPYSHFLHTVGYKYSQNAHLFPLSDELSLKPQYSAHSLVHCYGSTHSTLLQHCDLSISLAPTRKQRAAGGKGRKGGKDEGENEGITIVVPKSCVWVDSKEFFSHKRKGIEERLAMSKKQKLLQQAKRVKGKVLTSMEKDDLIQSSVSASPSPSSSSASSSFSSSLSSSSWTLPSNVYCALEDLVKREEYPLDSETMDKSGEISDTSKHQESPFYCIPLGTGAAVPSKFKSVSGHLVCFKTNRTSIEESSVPKYRMALLDCGEGTTAQMRHLCDSSREYMQLLTCIDTVIISHPHADHVVGSWTFVSARRAAFRHLHLPYLPLFFISNIPSHRMLRLGLRVDEEYGIGKQTDVVFIHISTLIPKIDSPSSKISLSSETETSMESPVCVEDDKEEDTLTSPSSSTSSVRSNPGIIPSAKYAGLYAPKYNPYSISALPYPDPMVCIAIDILLGRPSRKDHTRSYRDVIWASCGLSGLMEIGDEEISGKLWRYLKHLIMKQNSTEISDIYSRYGEDNVQQRIQQLSQTFSCVPVNHCAESYAVVCSGDGVVIGYSGDCMPCESFIREMRRKGKRFESSDGSHDVVLKDGMKSSTQPIVVCIHEATLSSSMQVQAFHKRHSTVEQALQVASLCEVDYLILTHFSQRFSRGYPDISEEMRNLAVEQEKISHKNMYMLFLAQERFKRGQSKFMALPFEGKWYDNFRQVYLDDVKSLFDFIAPPRSVTRVCAMDLCVYCPSTMNDAQKLQEFGDIMRTLDKSI